MYGWTASPTCTLCRERGHGLQLYKPVTPGSVRCESMHVL